MLVAAKAPANIPKGAEGSECATINFDLEGPGGFSSESDVSGGVITSDGGKVTVQRTKLLLDGKEVAKVPENAKVVLVEYKAGKLTVTADGNTIYPAAAGN